MLVFGGVALVGLFAYSEYKKTTAGVGKFLDNPLGIPAVDTNFLNGLWGFLGEVVNQGETMLNSNLPQWDTDTGGTTQPDLQSDIYKQQQAINKNIADVQYQNAVIQNLNSQGNWQPSGSGSRKTYTLNTPTRSITTSGAKGFSDVYNANFQVAGAKKGFVPAYNAGAVVAETIGGSSQSAWLSNLRAKGMNEADAQRNAEWHASRGETING